MSNGFFTSGSTGTTPNYNPVPNVLTNTSPNPVDASFCSIKRSEQHGSCFYFWF